jgi:hypothetical protein
MAGSGVYAVRNLLNLSPAIDDLAHSANLRSIAEEYLRKPSFPVRGTLFDKTGEANWLVPWHQDLTNQGGRVSCSATNIGFGEYVVRPHPP